MKMPWIFCESISWFTIFVITLSKPPKTNYMYMQTVRMSKQQTCLRRKWKYASLKFYQIHRSFCYSLFNDIPTLIYFNGVQNIDSKYNNSLTSIIETFLHSKYYSLSILQEMKCIHEFNMKRDELHYEKTIIFKGYLIENWIFLPYFWNKKLFTKYLRTMMNAFEKESETKVPSKLFKVKITFTCLHQTLFPIQVIHQ